MPLLRDVKNQMPDAVCELAPLGISRSLIVNRDKLPFDNPDQRQAMALSIDRLAFINIITEGQGDIVHVMRAFGTDVFAQDCHAFIGNHHFVPRWSFYQIDIPLDSALLSRVHWVRPELIAEVKYLTWTDDNPLRQVVYEGLREDRIPPRYAVRCLQSATHSRSG